MPLEIRELTIATHNRGKLAEFEGLLGDMPIVLRSLSDYRNIVEVDETGATFAENARLKAAQYALQISGFALADDSGLEIAALDGQPGVLSARYGGDASGFDKKMELVLREMASSGFTDRSARFVCSIAIADADGRIVLQKEGVCAGRIAESPRGNGGFGYDPIFIPDGFDLSFGELPGAVKHEISHRGRALAEIIPFLRDNTAI